VGHRPVSDPGLLAALAIVYAIRHTAAPTIREHRPIRLQIGPVLRGRLGRLVACVALPKLDLGRSRAPA